MPSGKESLEQVVEMIKPAADRNGFGALGEVAERHGSWQITFCKRTAGPFKLDRFVFLAFTSPDTAFNAKGEIDIWEGAEMGQKFTRRPGSTLRATSNEISGGSVRDLVTTKFQEAVERVNELGPDDLTDTRELTTTQAAHKATMKAW